MNSFGIKKNYGVDGKEFLGKILALRVCPGVLYVLIAYALMRGTLAPSEGMAGFHPRVKTACLVVRP